MKFSTGILVLGIFCFLILLVAIGANVPNEPSIEATPENTTLIPEPEISTNQTQPPIPDNITEIPSPIQNETERNQTEPIMTFLGLATRFTNTTHTVAQYIAVKNKMIAHGCNTIRLGSGDELWGSSYTWHNGDAVQWFLDNTAYTVVIDRHHTIGLTSLTTTQWNHIKTHLNEMAVTYTAYGDRVILEPLNEYAGTDFITRMQSIIDNFRGAPNNHTNWLLFNGFGASSAQPTNWNNYLFDDPLHKTDVANHYYMNNFGNNGTLAYNDLNSGHTTTSLPMIGSEEGAHVSEKASFTNANVAALSTYLQLCATDGFGNLVWMNHELDNMAEYETHGLVWPTLTPSKTFTGDGLLSGTVLKTFTGNAGLRATYFKSFTGNGLLSTVDSMASFTADAHLMEAFTQTFTGDGILVAEGTYYPPLDEPPEPFDHVIAELEKRSPTDFDTVINELEKYSGIECLFQTGVAVPGLDNFKCPMRTATRRIEST